MVERKAERNEAEEAILEELMELMLDHAPRSAQDLPCVPRLAADAKALLGKVQTAVDVGETLKAQVFVMLAPITMLDPSATNESLEQFRQDYEQALEAIPEDHMRRLQDSFERIPEKFKAFVERVQRAQKIH